MNIFDLQIQSTASDGKHTPREIVGMARDLGIRVIALTDHDTLGGVEEAVLAGAECGVRVIEGIEISVEEHGLHILGYGIDPENHELLRELEASRQGRIEGAKKMAENLRTAGFAIDWEDVAHQATGSVVARPHLARALLARPENKDRLGGAASVHDVIDRFLSDASPYYVRRAHIGARDAIAMIHGAGGAAVWSHPAIHFQDNYDELEKFLAELIAWKLDGLEVFNPSHTEDDVEYINALTARHGLLRTAGSDFHEAGDHPSDERGLHGARTLGDYETYGFATQDIVRELDLALQKRKSAQN